MEPVIKYLHTSKLVGEMVMLGYVCGGVAVLAGLLQAFTTPSKATSTTTCPR